MKKILTSLWRKLWSESSKSTPATTPLPQTPPTIPKRDDTRKPVDSLYLSSEGESLIKEFEACKLVAYKPLAHDVWTIGWGHTRTAKEGQRITQEEADNLFRSDVASFEKPLRQLLRGRVELTQYQWDALVSLVYNIGIGAFRKSKAYKSLCAKDEKAFVHQAFNPETGFVHSGGQKVRGLIRRRAREKDLFLGKPA